MNPTNNPPVKVEELASASATFKRKFNLLVRAITQLQSYAKTDRVIAGDGLSESETPNGRKFMSNSSGGGDGPTITCLYPSNGQLYEVQIVTTGTPVGPLE